MADVKIFDGSQWFSILGPQGEKGDKGDQGEKGDAGSGVTIKGTATTYPPSASPATGDMYLVPDPVPAGFPGGTDAGDGLVWSGTAWENVGAIRGPKGDKGDSGNDGADGAPGVDGAPGKDGDPGVDGKDGAVTVLTMNDTGVDASQEGRLYIEFDPYVSQGIYGPGGNNRGVSSLDPRFANNEIIAADVALVSKYGCWFDIKGAKGEKGDQGDPGLRGDKGDVGADGANGENAEVYVQASQPVPKRAGAIWIEP